MDILLRPATPQEVASYIIETWLNSYALSWVGRHMRADSRTGVGRKVYWAAQRAKIERILATPTVVLTLATLDGEPIGWCCYDDENRRVHYVFVNRIMRRQGVARKLIPEWFHDPRGGSVYVTHLPPPWYTRPREDQKEMWGGHVSIDLVSPC